MTNQVKFNKRELTIQGDYFDFSTLQKYTQLNRLEIYKSRITKLPELPATLTELNCDNCRLLPCLPELPATLTTLRCINCPLLTCLPELPATLTKLYCSKCPLLTCLPELPATLKILDCAECPLLTCLPELPATLTELSCSQEYFIDKYDYEINTSSIEKYRNDPITEERRERNGMFNIIFK